MLQVGQEAPDISLGETTLHALLARGPAVVFFFPQVFTAG